MVTVRGTHQGRRGLVVTVAWFTMAALVSAAGVALLRAESESGAAAVALAGPTATPGSPGNSARAPAIPGGDLPETARPAIADTPGLPQRSRLPRDERFDGVPGMVLVGTWTTDYPPSARNGFGANITVPAIAIDGIVVGPGATFDFLDAVGPITLARGYAWGGFIDGGRTSPRGAIGGGICAASTTVFNAAVRAGFEVLARRNHSYYIARYPLGLDATVYRDDSGTTIDMIWRNDTASPVVIRTFAGAGVIRVDLYSMPSGRVTSFSKPAVTHAHRAVDRVVRTTALAPGRERRLEVPADGMTVVVVRTVRAADGSIVHRDRFVSVYRRVDGILLVGAAG